MFLFFGDIEKILIDKSLVGKVFDLISKGVYYMMVVIIIGNFYSVGFE